MEDKDTDTDTDKDKDIGTDKNKDRDKDKDVDTNMDKNKRQRQRHGQKQKTKTRTKTKTKTQTRTKTWTKTRTKTQTKTQCGEIIPAFQVSQYRPAPLQTEPRCFLSGLLHEHLAGEAQNSEDVCGQILPSQCEWCPRQRDTKQSTRRSSIEGWSVRRSYHESIASWGRGRAGGEGEGGLLERFRKLPPPFR